MKLLMIGCGKMGGALLGGLIANNFVKSDILVVDRHVKRVADYGVKAVESIDEVTNFMPDVILLAVKPQMMDEILSRLKEVSSLETLVISVAAGKNLGYYEKALSDQPIIRVMPNLPALVGKGVSVMCANQEVGSDLKQMAQELFASVGQVFWLEDEAAMDAVTAISGSGPAYVFHFLECLVKAGQELGLPDELAKMLAYSTVTGSALLADQSDKTAKELKEQVMSPKGTTEAGINTLSKDHALEKLLKATTKAACDRSKELAV